MSGMDENDGFAIGAEAAWTFAMDVFNDLGEATVQVAGRAIKGAEEAIDLLASYGDAVLNTGAIPEIPGLAERNAAQPAQSHRDAPLPEDFSPYSMWNRNPR